MNIPPLWLPKKGYAKDESEDCPNTWVIAKINTNTNTIKEEALSALLALGFAKKGAESKIDKVLMSKPEIATVEDLVRTALSQM